ncbi:hypothetical protein ACIQ9R_19715 [Streptomyces sp. NPDC094447]|uniref:hypothetical protein n=1 Tax=Streptomyces sp. NPDC094447 TaxID=3366062 RepID=UPI003822B33D
MYEWNGRKVREKAALSSGPILVTIGKSGHRWERTLEAAGPGGQPRGRGGWRR